MIKDVEKKKIPVEKLYCSYHFGHQSHSLIHGHIRLEALQSSKSWGPGWYIGIRGPYYSPYING